MDAADQAVPQARDGGLVVHDLEDEVLVYDLQRHRAHALNRVAAWVWRHSDGQTNVAEMTKLLQSELGTPLDEGLIWLVLERLARARLLRYPVLPMQRGTGSSRRTLMRNLAAIGGLALVTSIVAPEAAQAATCLKAGASCTTDAQCCSRSCLGNHTCHS